MGKKTIRDINIVNKKILVRVDYNVSLFGGMKLGDDLRIRQTIPTIRYLLKKNCSVLLCSHLGDPRGKKKLHLSLRPVQQHLEKILDRKIEMIDDYITGSGVELVKKVHSGSLSLLENIRFYPGEERNEVRFARQLSRLAQIYVNDAFGVCHRIHASTVGITHFLPAVAGLLLEKEIKIINRTIAHPKRPFVVIIGGAKAKTKIPVIKSLMKKADVFLIDGGVGDTFLKAAGYEIGKSIVDLEMVAEARKILKLAKKTKTKILLADDLAIGTPETQDYIGIVPVDEIPKNMEALDIGPKTEVKFGNWIAKAKTIIWNGPMGVFEKEEFARGTNFIYQAIAANRDSLSIVGGGETLSALPKEEYLETIDHISTGGGAMLEFIEKGTLPAIEALEDK